MAKPILEALEALANIQGINLSDLMEDLGRDHLKAKGALPEITAEQINEELKRMQEQHPEKKKKKK